MTEEDERLAFFDWLAHAEQGAERPYPDHLGDLVSRAATLRLVARGWNMRVGKFCVRLRHNLGKGFPDE